MPIDALEGIRAELAYLRAENERLRAAVEAEREALIVAMQRLRVPAQPQGLPVERIFQLGVDTAIATIRARKP
jgi:hypothetical protein